MATRKVVYDDQDSHTIQYNGHWFTNAAAEETVGNFGPPYLHTLHGTNQDATVSFEFDGTAIEVYGSSIVANSRTNPDPNIECSVDGVSIGRETIFEFPENNWKVCGLGGFSAGPHTLQIDIMVQSPNQTFWLDQIRYVQSPSVSLENKTLMVANVDPGILLDKNWVSLAHFNATNVTNATARVDFIGTSVSWFGYIPVELPHQGTFCTYSIDGGQPVPFNLVGLAEEDKDSVYNQNFFTTPVVENGRHTLTVTFFGSHSTTPLTLDYLYITNGTLAASSSGTPNSSTAIGTTDTNTAGTAGDRGNSGLNIGALLGGILGGLALVIIIAGAFLYRRHRRLSQHNMSQRFRGQPGASIPVNYYSYSPFNTGPRVTPIPYGGVPTNQPSAKGRETIRIETRATKQSRGGPYGTGSQIAARDGFGRIDSGTRLDEPRQVEDILPLYTID